MAPTESQTNDIAESVRRVIAAMLPNGRPDVQRVARFLGKNPRTLQRRLAAVGTSYSRVLHEVRYGTALRLLGDNRLTCLEISVIMGYADPAHFTRAFKGWTGMSPRDFRSRRRELPIAEVNRE